MPINFIGLQSVKIELPDFVSDEIDISKFWSSSYYGVITHKIKIKLGT